MGQDDEFAVVGGRVVVPEGVRDDAAVVVRQGLIAAVLDRAEVAPSVRVVDVGDRTVVPGLIDVHAHGAAGCSFDDPDPGAHEEILRYHARQGVTAMQASLVSASWDGLVERLAALRQTMTAAGQGRGARLLGAHLEGPFLARGQAGAHDPAVLRAPVSGDAERLLEFGDVISMVTVAPELPHALGLIRRLADAGVVVAAGHSEATGADLRAAVDVGLRHITHLWSGQSGVVRFGPWRLPGLLEESLASDGLTAEVIADGRHLPPVLLEIARRCLGDRLVVISDATAGTGMPVGYRYRLGAVDCEVVAGVGMVVGADSFGGSVTAAGHMVAYLHKTLGWPLHEVVHAASGAPAAVLGLGHRKGAVAPGYDADLTVFGADFAVWGTLVAGAWAYRSDQDG